MARKKMFIALASVLLSAMPVFAQSNTTPDDSDPVYIPTNPTPKKGCNKGHKDPSDSPLTCTLMGDCLSVFCYYDVMGEVVVMNNETLETMTSGACNLGQGVILTLDNYTPGSMTLTV
ncbi:MAG: hypothetical protein K2K97_01190, partial [Muribaculaceae bacterium]|nr:hypothetical protein [Muribaculaceae bacterium]